MTIAIFCRHIRDGSVKVFLLVTASISASYFFRIFFTEECPSGETSSVIRSALLVVVNQCAWCVYRHVLECRCSSKKKLFFLVHASVRSNAKRRRAVSKSRGHELCMASQGVLEEEH